MMWFERFGVLGFMRKLSFEMFGASGAREQQLGLAAERECCGFNFLHVLMTLSVCLGACGN